MRLPYSWAGQDTSSSAVGLLTFLAAAGHGRAARVGGSAEPPPTAAEVEFRKSFSLKCPSYLYVKHGQVRHGFVASHGGNLSPWKAAGMFPASVLQPPALGCRCMERKPQLQAVNPERIAAWQLCVREQAERLTEREISSC